jgi:hypothetical protein
MNKLETIIAIVALLPVSCLSQEGSSKERIEPSRLRDHLPPKVSLLVPALTEAFQKGKTNVADSNDHYIRRAKEGAMQWILKIIRKDQLPPDPNVLRRSIVLLQNAIGPNDVAVCRWEKDARVLTVVQTRTVILIEVRPKSDAVRAETTREARALLARNTTLGVLNGQVDIEERGPTTLKVVKRVITPVMLATSFDHADIQEYQGGIHGRCAGPPNDFDLDYNYWWRRISWWTDGRIVGLYTLKVNRGAWVPSYDATLDATWFERPPSLRPHQD